MHRQCRTLAARTLTAAVVMLFAAHSAPAGGLPERGEDKSVACVACHGPQGLSPNPMFPHLAGQNSTYLELQLHHFRTGERYHPLMTPVAKALTDRDIEDLAAYYATIPLQVGSRE